MKTDNPNRGALEERLYEFILMTLGMRLDCKHGNLPTHKRDKLAEKCIEASTMLSQQIIEGIRSTYGRLDPKRVEEIVDQALQYCSADAKGQILLTVEESWLRESIATWTARCVAPPGSAWALSIEKWFTEQTGAFLRAVGVPECEAKEIIECHRKELENVRRIASFEIDQLQSGEGRL